MRSPSILFAAETAVIDADYVVVTPELRAPQAISDTTDRAPEGVAGMDLLRRNATIPATAKPERGSPLFWAGGITLAAMAFWVAGGHELFRQGLAPVQVASGLRIAAFNSRVDESGLNATLMVDGEAINDGLDPAVLPPLEIQVTSGNGMLTRYKLGTVGAQLAAGDVFPFSGRLDLPKHGVKTVSVAFVE